jgi:DNA polymerase/3'-5' exonuclease PolX
MSEEKRYPRAEALAVAKELYDILTPFCSRCKVVGSLRRYKSTVKDIELLFIPKMAPDPSSLMGALFGTGQAEMIDLADLTINRLVKDGVLRRRETMDRALSWGPLNKFAVHVASGIPVDLFASTEENWWNSVVCRTGSANSNKRLAAAALAKGWTFEAYGSGFRKLGSREHYQTKSEQDVFRFAGLQYVAPQYRS